MLEKSFHVEYHFLPHTTSVRVCSRTGNMSFLDMKDPTERATLVKGYVTAMKTVKQHYMVNREMKLAIGDALLTLFHPIVNATKQAAEETRKELAPMKKTLTDIDGALTAQRAADARPPLDKNVDTTWETKLQLIRNKKTLTVDDTEYDFTPGLHALIMSKLPRGIPMIIKHINLFVHRPRLDNSQISQVLLDHKLHGNISICSGKWLYLGKG